MSPQTPEPDGPIVIPPVVGATLLEVRLEGGVESWRCPACGEANASADVLLHAQDCPVEARIVAMLVWFEALGVDPRDPSELHA